MPERFVLFIEGGSRAGERIPLSGDRFTIGRKPGNSLVLQDASVSGSHCELLRTADGWLIRDTGSTNGTFVGGAKINLPTTLKMGSKFALGSVAMSLVEEAKGAAPTADDDEISLEEPSSAPPSNSKDTISKTNTTIPPAPKPQMTGADLDFVEDEPAPASPYVPDKTVNMPAAAASAMGIRTAPMDLTKDSAPVVADAQTLDRARQAAADQAKKGRMFIIGGGVVAAAALGGASYILFFNNSGGGPAVVSPPVVAGNLLTGAAANLEAESETDNLQKGVRWHFRDSSVEPEGAAAIGFVNSSKKVASGERAAEARLDGPSYARATTDFIKVSSGQTLQFAAQVSAAKAPAALQMIFKGKGEGSPRIVKCGESTTGENNKFTKISGAARVPAGCDQAALSIVTMGDGGTVVFDDASIVPAADGTIPASIQKREIEFEQDPIDGRIRRIDKDLVRSMGVLIGAPKARARILAAGREGDTWTLFSPSGVAGKLNLTMESNDTAVLYHYKYDGSSPAALHWTVDRGYASEVIVRGSKTTGRYRGEFTEPACKSLVFGEELNRLRVAFDPPCAVQASPDPSGIRLEIELTSALNISIQYSFDAEKRLALELEQKAETAQKQNKFGEEIATRSRILEEFPFERALVERNETKRDLQLARGQKLASDVERAVSDAEFFKIPQAFREAKRAGEELANAYAGTDVAERAKAAISAVDQLLAEAEGQRGERDALRLQTIASAFDAAKAKDLGIYIREYLKKNYPATKAAQGGDK